MSVITMLPLMQTDDSTASSLYVDGEFVCFTIEDGFRKEKIKHNTRIAGGYYDLKPYYHGKFATKYNYRYGHPHVWQIADVPKFTGILIHIGNYIEDTSGCILPNKAIGFKDGVLVGQGSGDAYLELCNKLEWAVEHTLIIHR